MAPSGYLGFAVDGVAMIETDARYAGYDEARSRIIYDELLERVRAIPGVDAATLTRGAPIADFLASSPLVIDGYEPANGDAAVPVQWVVAGPGYFDALEIPILYGRAFEELDGEDSKLVVVVNETMARRYFGTPNAVGRRFRFEDTGAVAEIVGVASDTLDDLMTDEGIQPRFFQSPTQTELPATTVLARASIDEATLVGAMRAELRAIDPSLPVIRARTMASHLSGAGQGLRLLIESLGGLALLGMSLAGLGLYAVVSYAVTNRFREIGIRMALGARRASVIHMVARDVAVLVAVGVGLGTALSVAAVFGLQTAAALMSRGGSNIMQPSADHPGTFAVVALVMMAVGLAAAYLPARKAATIDPLDALRHS